MQSVIPDAVKYLVLAAAPPLFHMSSMFGSALLEPIRTGIRKFDELYNRLPLLISVLCGLTSAMALAASQVSDSAFAVLVGAAILLFLVDVIATALSVYRYAQRK